MDDLIVRMKNVEIALKLDAVDGILSTPAILTVCKSLRNKINVTNPAPIPIGAKLVHASN